MRSITKNMPLECCQRNAAVGYDCLIDSLESVLGPAQPTKLLNGIDMDYMSVSFPDDSSFVRDYEFSALVDVHLGEAVTNLFFPSFMNVSHFYAMI